MSHLIVTYNLLTPPYAQGSYFFGASPDDLDASVRLLKIMAKLQEYTDKGAIIAMQEVSQTWLAALVPWFEQRGYTVVASNYDEKQSDYMGVALAIPRAKYAIEEIDIVRVGDTLPLARAPEPGMIASIATAIINPIRAAAAQMLPVLAEPMDVWKKAQKRPNALVSAVLLDSEQKRFVVGVYHMPCIFWSPAFMLVHAALAKIHVQKLSIKHKNAPYVLAGDFNLKPTDPAYQLLTTNKVDADSFPHVENLIPASPEHQLGLFDTLLNTVRSGNPLTSAYHKKHGEEPGFTYKAQIRQTFDGKTTEREFVECLDYIFLGGDGWTVTDARVVVADPDKFQPHADEPSDHNLLCAQLSF